MKLVLTLCFLILGQLAYAGQSQILGDDDDTPAKKAPAKTPIAQPANTAVKQPAAGKKPVEDEWISCSKGSTDDSEDVLGMFRDVLGVSKSYPFAVVQSGFMGVTVSLGSYKDKIVLSAAGKASASGQVCKLSESQLRVRTTVDGESYTLIVTKVNAANVNIVEQNGKFTGGTFGVR